jgi:hypothetical protein
MRLAKRKMFLALPQVVLSPPAKKSWRRTSRVQQPERHLLLLIGKDTAMLSRDIYLWYAQIPATFNAQSYSTQQNNGGDTRLQ